MVIMESKKLNKEEMESRLHELSVEIVGEARNKYSKTNMTHLTIREKTKEGEENTEDTMYISPELYGEYYKLLYELEKTLKEPEQESITIEYKPKKKEYQVVYGGDGLDFDDYRQVGAWYADKVTDEEVQNIEQESERSKKEKKLKKLMETDEQLDAKLSAAKEKGKTR